MKLTSIFAALTAVVMMSLPVTAQAQRPNIIFILTDDISPKDYAFYGGKTVSPVLETMAKGRISRQGTRNLQPSSRRCSVRRDNRSPRPPLEATS